MSLDKLLVMDASKKDAGRGLVRIDPEVERRLSLKPGDVLEIRNPSTGKRTAAILYPGRKEDKGTNIIRIDPSLRRNIDAAINDIVEIRKIDAVLASEVTFAGLEEPVTIRNSQELARKLENRATTKGDILSFYAMGRRVDLVVVDYMPKAEVVGIHLDTTIILSEYSSKEFKDSEKSDVSYNDIGGLDDKILKLREMIELPIKRPEVYKQLGINPPNGILLYGPPGTGKTSLAWAIAKETNVNFKVIKGPEIMSKFYGKSEENLREIFDKAKSITPSIIFIDNLDSLAIKRYEKSGDVERRVLIQLLSLMDDLKSKNDVFLIGATNRIEDIDPAIRSRFDLEIEIGIPNQEARFEILQIHTRGMNLHDDVNLRQIAEDTKGFVGADLESLVKEAAMIVVRETLQKLKIDEKDASDISKTIKIEMRHFLEALSNKSNMVSCPKCESEYRKKEDINFCAKCGEKLIDKKD